MPRFPNAALIVAIAAACCLFVTPPAAVAQVQHTAAVLDANQTFTGTNQFLLGTLQGPTTFAGLPLAANGTIIYCQDCVQTNPCAGSGTGAMAQRINGAWACSGGGGGGGGTVTGSGTTNFIPVWTSGTALGNSHLQDVSSQIQSSEIIVATGASLGLTMHGSSSGFTCGLSATAFFNGSTGCPAIQGDTSSQGVGATGIISGVVGEVPSSTSFTGAPLLAGVYGIAVPNGSDSPGWIAGTVGYAQMAGVSGTVANLSGLVGVVNIPNGNGQTATIMNAVDAQVRDANLSTVQPSAYALYARSPAITSGATISHVYGLYVDDQTPGGAGNPDPHGIHEAGSAPNDLGGSLTVPTLIFSADTNTSASLQLINAPALGVYVYSNPASWNVTATSTSAGTATLTVSNSSGWPFTFMVNEYIITSGIGGGYDCAMPNPCALTAVNSGAGTVSYLSAGSGSFSSGTINIITLSFSAGAHKVGFNSLHSTSNNAAQSGSIQLGPTDAVRYGCLSCSTSTITGGTDQNLISGNGSTGPANLADSLGAKMIGPLTLGNLAGGGTQCVQVSNTGVVSATGSACGSGGGTGTVNSAAQYSFPWYSGAGSNNIISGIAPPTTNGTYLYGVSVSASVAAQPALFLPGVPFDTQSGSTYTIVGASSGSATPATDRSTLLQTTNNTTSTAVAIPQAGSTGFGGSYSFIHLNTGSVVATDTPVTSTVNGNATLKLVGAVAGHNPEAAFWWSDNTNWWASIIPATDANGLVALESLPNIPFSNIGPGTNTTAAMINGTGSSISTSGSGQNAGTQIWAPPFLTATSGTMTLSGGSFLSGHATSARYTLSNAAGFTLASQPFESSNTTLGCSSGSTCQLTLNSPTTPQTVGFITYSVYAQDCGVTPCGGSEVLQAACTNVAIGTSCVLNSVGAGAALPTVATAYVQPPNLQASECQPGAQPFGFGQDNAGNYHTWMGTDQFSNNGITAGYFEICHATRFIDNVFGPPAQAYALPFNNSFIDIVHMAGVNTSLANQDRALSVNMQNPINDSTTRYGQEALQVENDVHGHPLFTGSPDGAISAFSGQMSYTPDSSYTGGTPTSGIQAIRLDMDYAPASTAGGNAQAIQAVMNSSATAAPLAGTQLSVMTGTINGAGWGNAFGTFYKMNWPTSGQTPTAGIFGLYMGSGTAPLHSNATGPLDFLIRNDKAGLNSYLNGPVWLGAIQNDAENPTLAITGSTVITPSITTAQGTIAAPSSVTGSGGSSSYSYAYVGVDSNGGQVPSTSVNSSATLANPLTSGNPATINFSLTGGAAQIGQFVRIDIYRTGGPMAFGKIGSLTCQSVSWAPSCSAFSDTGLAASGTVPTGNSTGSINAVRFYTNIGIAQTSGNIALSGWGTGAAVSAVSGYDQASTFTVTAGTTPSANPTITVTLSNKAVPNGSQCGAWQTGGSGIIGDVFVTQSTTAPVFTWEATPTNAATYIFTTHCWFN